MCVKKWFKCNLILDSMKRYLRKVVKKSDRKFEHVMSIPVDMVRKLDLSDSIVELKIRNDSIVIKKLPES